MGEPGFVRSLDVVSAVDQVTLEIRRSILSGDLGPGQEFSLRKIAEQLGVSLIPVREALRRLESQGLVVTRRAKSAMVAPLDPQEFRDVYRLRLTIEPELAGRASALLTDDDLERLDELQVAHARAPDGDERHQAHHAFHTAMLRPAATPWDARVLDMLWHASERYVGYAFNGIAADPSEPARRGKAHSDLVAAIRTGESKTASEALARHLIHTETIVLNAIETLESGETRASLRMTPSRVVEKRPSV
jgi:DNA-binding GntR family transcriptional regulator